MGKLRLRVDELAVESFPTSPEPDPEAGTVFGAMGTRTAQCGTCAEPTCQGATCQTSCGGGGDPACTCPP
jgi:hypothetical protein